MRNETIALVRTQGVAALVERQLPKMFEDTTTPIAQRTRQWMLEQPADATIAALEALRDRPDSTALLERIDVPTLVVCGEKDVVTTPGEMRAMAQRIARAEYVEIPSAGHLAHLEQPSVFHSALSSFLRRLG